MIEIVLNGETHSLPLSTSVATALTLWGYRCEQIAVAINGEFVARAGAAGFTVQELIDQLNQLNSGTERKRK